MGRSEMKLTSALATRRSWRAVSKLREMGMRSCGWTLAAELSETIDTICQ